MRSPVKNPLLTAALALLCCASATHARSDPQASKQGQGQSSQLDAELLVAHPGLVTNDRQLLRADILDALETEPNAPLAAVAAHVLWDLEIDGGRGPAARDEAMRFARLAALVSDAEASLLLRRQIYRSAKRSRFTAQPIQLPADLYTEFVSTWRVVGPLGALDIASPSLAPAPSDSPEPLESNASDARARIVDSYVTSTGEERPWRRVRRRGNSLNIDVLEHIHPVGGQTYALAFIAVPAAVEGGSAVLELRARGAVHAWWNGASAVHEPRTVPQAARDRFLVRVPVHTGWNALLVRVSAGAPTRIAARILDDDGRALSIVEPGPDQPLLVDWSVGGATALLPPPLLESPILDSDDDPFTPALKSLCALLARRPDIALTIAPPTDEAGLGAWRLLRLRALNGAGHLPAEIRRRRQIELVDSLERDGPFFAEARAARVGRLLREDRPAEALAAVDAWIEAMPDRAWPHYMRTFALDAIDRFGLLGRLNLEDLVAVHTGHMGARARLAQIARDSGDAVGSLQMAWDLLVSTDSLGAGSNDDVLDMVVKALAPVDQEAVASLLDRAQAWFAQVPGSTEARGVVERLRIALGRNAERLAIAEDAVRAHPGEPTAWWNLGNLRLRMNDREGAHAAFRHELQLTPADGTTRALVALLGDEDPAERFFARFEPDERSALAAAEGVEDTSVVEALDSGLVYYFPDGSYHARYRTLSIARDRTGAETLHSIPVSDDTREIRVLARDGRVLEPVDVDGEWVLPALEPGDTVEVVWDLHGTGVPGGVPEMRRWRFASFERAFPTSRWVVHIPASLDARFNVRWYEGTHEEVPWEDGIAHVFESSNPRLVGEPWQPSDAEIIPAADFGQDRDRADELRTWSAHALAMSAIPADLESELLEFVHEHVAERPGARVERSEAELVVAASALYAALEERIQDYEGGRDAATVWQEKRGWPIFLLAAIYERAEIPFEWAVLETGVSPELDNDPVESFAGARGLAREALRLSLHDQQGDPVWVLYSGLPGTPFAALSSTIVGARAHVLQADGTTRAESLPRTQQDAAWNAEIALTYTLDRDGNAAVRGRFADSTPEGRINARRLREATAEQRDRLARGQASSIAPGVDIKRARLVLDGSDGEGLVLHLEGVLPGFARESRGGFEARVPFLALGLATRFGPAERHWPLALRQAYRLRVSIEIDTGEHWKIVGAPAPLAEIREGFAAELAVETPSGRGRAFTQRLEQRGLVLPAEDVPAFLARLGELEKEFARPLRLERAQPK